MLKNRAEKATFNGILIGSVVMTEILVCAFDAVSGPGAPLLVHRARVPVALARRRELGEAVRAGVHARFGLFPHAFLVKGASVKKERK